MKLKIKAKHIILTKLYFRQFYIMRKLEFKFFCAFIYQVIKNENNFDKKILTD